MIEVFRWGAVCLMFLSFAGLAWTFSKSLTTGAADYSDTLSEEASRQFEDLFLFIPPKRIAEIGWSAAGIVFLLFAVPLFDIHNAISTLAGIALGVIFGVLALMTPKKVIKILKDKRRFKFNIQLIDALSNMSNALRAGFSINQAFETVVQNGEKPISQEFGVMLQQMRVGMNFYDAMQSLDTRVGSDDLTLVVTAIDIARRTGGNLTEIFDKISITIRERMRIERRVRTLTAQGRLQGIIVACMPAVLGGIMTFIKPDLMLPFIKSSYGVIAIGLTVLLIGMGWFVISKIIKIDV
ncbi:MAG: type II secretion system F family protein [Kiritimatiellae bacterium]|nr:type II secretion system F family protein [Kiritimatiellia bacterium]